MVLWAHLPISHEPQPTRKWNCWVILPPHPHPRRVCAASREGSLIPLTLSPRWLCLWYSLLEGWEDSPHHSCNPQVSEIVRVSVSLMVIAPSWILGDLLGQGPCPSVVEMDSSFVYLLVKFFFFLMNIRNWLPIIYALSTEKWNTFWHINKQGCQSLQWVAALRYEPVKPEGTQEGEEELPSRL